MCHCVCCQCVIVSVCDISMCLLSVCDVSLCLCVMCDHICYLCVMCQCVCWNGYRCTKAGVEEEEVCNGSVVCV